MNRRRLFAIAYKEALQIWRDPRSLAIALLMPLMQMALLGYGVSLDIKHVQLCVYDQERSQISRELIDSFSSSGWFDVVMVLGSDRHLKSAIDSRACVGALTIPPDFSRRLAASGGSDMQVVFDGTDTNTTNIASGYAKANVAKLTAAFLERWTASHGLETAPVQAIDLRTRVWFNEGLDSRNFIIPGVVAVILASIGAQLTSLTISREWERGTMEQLISTPVTAFEVMLGKLLPYFAIALVDAGFCLIVAAFWFDVPFRGNVATLVITTSLFAIVILGIGYLLSVRIRSQLGASQIALILTMLPTTMLSGYTFPIDQMPVAIQVVTFLVYARYYITILRGVFLKGSSLADLAMPVAALTVFAIVIGVLAARAFKKRLD
ncbi:ABC transporter permease [Rhizobium sp. BK376]|uniref:ABC transporter permease n=1 Tax=Rhizobium sp. BK376 TaxID=2512149 RepID=UPI00105092BB|nr:ABC transporter permease [Rhizobium sp. BK376]TCR75627.1 ABC-2 type transport system permease protein [Rhizobium sp. BK376]